MQRNQITSRQPAPVQPEPKISPLVVGENEQVDLESYKVGFSGTENIGQDKLSLPMLIITDKDNLITKHFDEGKIFNTITDEVMDSTFVIPLKAVEGFHICEHDDESNRDSIVERVDSKEQLPPDTHHAPGKSYSLTPEGLRVYPIIEVYCLDADMNICKIQFKKSKFKKGKKWVTQMKMNEHAGPACAFVYEIGAVEESYNQYTYFNYIINQVGRTNPEIFKQACVWFKNVDNFIADDKNNAQSAID